MNNHKLNLETCSFCLFINKVYPNYKADTEIATRMIQRHFAEIHHIILDS